MPLISTIGQIHTGNPYYVRFPMEDRGKLVNVHISAHSLGQRAARDGLCSNNLLLLFCAYREEIEAAASAKYDNGHCDGADVVVVDRDLSAACSAAPLRTSPSLVPALNDCANASQKVHLMEERCKEDRTEVDEAKGV